MEGGRNPAKTHSPICFGGFCQVLPQPSMSCVKASPGPYFDATMRPMGLTFNRRVRQHDIWHRQGALAMGA
jgi:hypothetical protein